MTDSHSYSFFGQNTGMILRSYSKQESIIFLHFFKQKANGAWEKPSEKEGKLIKLSLEEMVLILDFVANPV